MRLAIDSNVLAMKFGWILQECFDELNLNSTDNL